ncbi:hypothetical protein FRB90_008876 [Tulasnella sp. 427]|nr:hypothetical protein FRB90_008876 [Tulasnella sp. 427]
MTSAALHIIIQRDLHRSERFHLATKTTILEELVQRIQRGDPALTSDEVNKSMRLADTHSLGAPDPGMEKPQEKTSWRDTIFGRKRDPRREEVELEAAKKMWEEALTETSDKLTQDRRSEVSQPSTISAVPPSSTTTPIQAPQKSGKAVFY